MLVAGLPVFFSHVFSRFSRFFSLPEVKKPKTLKCLQKPKKPWMPTWTCLAKWRSRVAEPENQSASVGSAEHTDETFDCRIIFDIDKIFAI